MLAILLPPKTKTLQLCIESLFLLSIFDFFFHSWFCFVVELKFFGKFHSKKKTKLANQRSSFHCLIRCAKWQKPKKCYKIVCGQIKKNQRNEAIKTTEKGSLLNIVTCVNLHIYWNSHKIDQMHLMCVAFGLRFVIIGIICSWRWINER